MNVPTGTPRLTVLTRCGHHPDHPSDAPCFWEGSTNDERYSVDPPARAWDSWPNFLTIISREGFASARGRCGAVRFPASCSAVCGERSSPPARDKRGMSSKARFEALAESKNASMGSLSGARGRSPGRC
eukprot:30173-Chlamydomonas_euryale.AAC.6